MTVTPWTGLCYRLKELGKYFSSCKKQHLIKHVAGTNERSLCKPIRSLTLNFLMHYEQYLLFRNCSKTIKLWKNGFPETFPDFLKYALRFTSFQVGPKCNNRHPCLETQVRWPKYVMIRGVGKNAVSDSFKLSDSLQKIVKASSICHCCH